MRAPKSHRAAAVVIGLDSITGLQTARLLATRGVEVIALAGDRSHFACRTRVCRRIIFGPTSGDGLIERLASLRETVDVDPALIPCSDAAVTTLSDRRDRLSGYAYALPDRQVVATMMDKARFHRYAEAMGLPVPRTVVLADLADARAAAGDLRYPAVLKPASKGPTWHRHTREKAYLVHDERELLARYRTCAAWSTTLLAQEWIPGPETNHFTCNCYFDRNSVPLVTFVSRKLRQWPPRTGTGCLSEEVRNDDVLRETLRLFAGIQYQGFGYLELKADERTGRLSIVEPNIGRPTGRSAIAEAGGVELLYTAYCDLVGLPLPAARTQRYVGAKWIYARQDLQSALHYWRRRELGIRPWWRSLRGRKVDAVFSRSDPLPFAADLVRVAQRAWRRAVVGSDARPTELRDA